MAQTNIANLIDPEVLADYVDKKLVDKSVFLAVAENDDTLVGNEGDELTFPVYNYIGDATVVAEGQEIPTSALTTGSEKVKVYKLAKGAEVTDESVLSAKGDPVNEVANQEALALASKLDSDMKALIDDKVDLGEIPHIAITSLDSDTVIDLEAVFGEDLNDKPMALIANGASLASLRKDSNYINGSEIQTERLLNGAIGELWGAQILPANRAKSNVYLIKSGAIRFVNKRGTNIETERYASRKCTGIFGDKIVAPYVYKKNDIVVGKKYSDVNVTEDLIDTVAVDTKTKISLSKFANAVPQNVTGKFYAKLASAEVSKPTFGSAMTMTGYTEITGDSVEITTSTNTHYAVVFVDADNKPYVFESATI